MCYKFIRSNGIMINLSDEDKKQISSLDKIQEALKLDTIIAFDIFKDNVLIGFALLRHYGKGYFLWDYAIDSKLQGKGYGSSALKALLLFLKEKYGNNEVTTTYLWGNEKAKHVYEKIGFVEIEVVNEQEIHEVNMIINI